MAFGWSAVARTRHCHGNQLLPIAG